MILKNFAVIAAILLLGFVPSQLGKLIIEHGGWVGQTFGHHAADLDAVSGKFLIVGGGVWFWLLLDSIWLRWLNIKEVVFPSGTEWEHVDTNVRAIVVLGYFLAFLAVVLGFTQGMSI